MSISQTISVVIQWGNRKPSFATPGAAGLDLPLLLAQNYYLFPGSTVLFSTGIKIAIPRGYEGQIRPRSSIATKTNIIIPNSPGTIDSDYRGEIKIPLRNIGNTIEIIAPGDRVAQLIIAPCAQVEISYAPTLSPTTRGEGGFGSTGR